MDHFNHAQYTAALEGFDTYVQTPLLADAPSAEREEPRRLEAEYCAALCAVYLYHKDAVWRIDQFIDQHPESTWVPKLRWELGNYQYRRKKVDQGHRRIQWTHAQTLKQRTQGQSSTSSGAIPFLKKSELSEARSDLMKVADDPSASPAFLEAARYYLAHIAYAEDRLTTALTAFEALLVVDAFRNAVPCLHRTNPVRPGAKRRTD